MPIRPVPHRDLLQITGTADQLPQILVRWDATGDVTHVTAECGGEPALVSVAELLLDDDCPTCTASSIPDEITRTVEAIVHAREQLLTAEELLQQLKESEEELRRIVTAGPGPESVERLGTLHTRLTTQSSPLLDQIEAGPVVGPVRTFLATRLDIVTRRVTQHLESPETREVLEELASRSARPAPAGTGALVETGDGTRGLHSAVLVAYGNEHAPGRHLVTGPGTVVGWALQAGFGHNRVALETTGLSLPALETIAGLWEPGGAGNLSSGTGLRTAAELLSE